MNYTYARARLTRLVDRQNGFTMVELMVALLIGLFLMGGLLVVVQDNKRTFTSQNQLARLQDTERLAMTMLTDTIQQSGYFPNPTINTAASVFPYASSFGLPVGQSLQGSYNASPPGETMWIRYASAPGDGILGCDGSGNKSVGTYEFRIFYFVNVGQLWCYTELGGPWQLVGDGPGFVGPNLPVNVTNLSFLYGINSTGASSNVDMYKNASQMVAPADWNNVISVQITLTFTNPLWSAAAQGQGTQAQFVSFTRVVDIMRQTGI